MTPIIQSSAAVIAPETDFSDKNPAIRTEAVYVIVTTLDESLAAARVARDLSAAMDVPVVFVHFRTVRFTPSENPPAGISLVETEALVTRLRAEGRDASVRVYCCRSARQAIAYAFKPHSLLVVAGQRSWWPTGSQRWRRALEAAGHFVVFVDVPEKTTRAVAEADRGWGHAPTSWSR